MSAGMGGEVQAGVAVGTVKGDDGEYSADVEGGGSADNKFGTGSAVEEADVRWFGNLDSILKSFGVLWQIGSGGIGSFTLGCNGWRIFSRQTERRQEREWRRAASHSLNERPGAAYLGETMTCRYTFSAWLGWCVAGVGRWRGCARSVAAPL
jgi:hypothetical protein